MSWANELYQVYETQCGREFDDGNTLMPISHSTANAQIEVTLNKMGEFIAARELSKDEGKNTRIPVSEDSASRTSGISAMPFADKLVYIAGDYNNYAKNNKADNSKYYQLYFEQLRKWHKSKYTHPAVDALYRYISKKCMIKDLINCGIITLDENTGRFADKVKISGIAQEDSFVRFRINGLDEPQTWKDESLSDAFILWYGLQSDNVSLCYATGRILPLSSKHPSKIRNSGDKAKLISANDESGFTYLGRFVSSDEALTVSYDFSQKMHNALKWLIQRQGMSFDTLTMIVWASTLQPLPDIHCAGLSDDDYFEDDETNIPDTQKMYCELLRKRIFGDKGEMSINTKVMLMCVDAATTGRLSVSLYTELEGSRFMNNLIRWHEDTAAVRWNGKQKRFLINSFSVYNIINCAYGTEMTKGSECKLECKKETLKDNILRLIPCITQGRPLPADIVNALFRKASNPLSYEKVYNHRMVVETACGMIRKHNIDRKVGITVMAYDPTITDRSYLYGCLLAVADAAERSTYEKDENDRITNARRYWSAFSYRPCKTWSLIEERLRPYLDKLGKKSVRYEKMINEIMEKMGMNSFMDNSSLSPAYLLGYHHYTNKIYLKKEEI